jgi:8-oxo-dGTP diphosphatase
MARAQRIVCKNHQVLMIRHQHAGQSWCCLPEDVIEPGGSPAKAALPELKEECYLEGVILRETSRSFQPSGEIHYTFLVDIG